MNILFLTQVLPYPIDAGPKVRAYYNLRYLAEKHAVTLLSFVRPTDSSDAIDHLRSFCTRVETVKMPRSRIRDAFSMLKSILSNQPFLITRDEVPEMDFILRNLVHENRFDAVHADQLWMAAYAMKAEKEAVKQGYHPRIILDQHNAVYLIPKRMAEASQNKFMKIWLKRESKLMAEFEMQTCRQFDHTVWVTREDLEAVRSIPGSIIKNNLKTDYQKDSNENNTVIPICVDIAEASSTDGDLRTNEILFVGGMHWPPNADGVTWFTKEVLPLVIKDYPQTRFVAIGKQPPEAITSIGEKVFAPGYVENIDSYWSTAKVFVVPLRAGGGMRVKILDAWARGLPIVSTTIGAEGITYNSGTDIFIADTPEQFARAVVQILKDNDLAVRLSLCGRKTLENHYDWKKVYAAWDKVYNPANDSTHQF